MESNKLVGLVSTRTLVTVGASTVVGLLGDIIIYSLAESKGQSFRLHIPKGKDLINLVVLGIVVGLVIDLSVKKIEDLQKLPAEKKLDELVEEESKKVQKGIIAENQNPVEVVWKG